MYWLFDLDNTLVDRDGAFRAWARAKLMKHGLDDERLPELVRVDAGGFAPKPAVARAIIDATGDTASVDDVMEEMRRGIRAHIAAYPGIPELLHELLAAGDRIAVVTNGEGPHQRGKLELAGLADLPGAVVVSGEIGHAKPDPRPVAAALERLGGTPGQAWMIGDAGHADVAAGIAAGLRTGWVSHGRDWTDDDATPDVIGTTTHDVVHRIRSS